MIGCVRGPVGGPRAAGEPTGDIPRDIRRIGGIPIDEVDITSVPCSVGRGDGIFHAVSILYGVDRLLRLDGARMTLFASQGDGGFSSVDLTGIIGRSHTIDDMLAIASSQPGRFAMSVTYGTWEDAMDVIVIHVGGRGGLSVITPRGASRRLRDRLVTDMRHAVRFAEGGVL